MANALLKSRYGERTFLAVAEMSMLTMSDWRRPEPEKMMVETRVIGTSRLLFVRLGEPLKSSVARTTDFVRHVSPAHISDRCRAHARFIAGTTLRLAG